MPGVQMYRKATVLEKTISGFINSFCKLFQTIILFFNNKPVHYHLSYLYFHADAGGISEITYAKLFQSLMLVYVSHLFS